MIYLDVNGRCGNQMFQYAFAKKISELNQDEITVDFTPLYHYGKSINDPTFKDELQNFMVSDTYRTIEQVKHKVLLYGSKRQKTTYRIYLKLRKIFMKLKLKKDICSKIMSPFLNNCGIYWYFTYKNLKPCKEKNKFIYGYFENPSYFTDMRSHLIKSFEPKYPIKGINKELYNIIENSESVCISVRRWINMENELKVREICNQEYLEKAIQEIIKKVPNAVFIVFSNDIQWVKEKIRIGYQCYYEDGTDEIWEKMRLMYSCKHFILSNSTFSWWAQYLCQNPEKVVISPHKWLLSDKKRNPLILDSFILI